MDFAATYHIPVLSRLEPYLKLEFRNLLNNRDLVDFNTTVTPDYDGPVDELGLPTEYLEGPRFGEATSNLNYFNPRTFLLSVGFRF